MKALSITILFCCAAVLKGGAAVVTVTSQSDLTFRGDTTYYVPNAVTLSGVTTFEEGTVIKYASGASLSVSSVNWQGTSYHPAILTAKDDNSVGATISGSTGHPWGSYYANPALSFSNSAPSTWEMANFRIAFAQQAIVADCVSFTLSLYDGQIVDCANGINVPGQGNVYLRNLLFAGVQTAFNDPSYVNFEGENVTFGGLTNYIPSFLISTYNSGDRSFSFFFRNCIFANYYAYIQGGTQGPNQTLSGDNNGFWSLSQTPPAPFGDQNTQTIAAPGTAVFQAVGAGYYYLTASSVFHGKAVTSIDPVLLGDLPGKTTTAPAGPPTPQPSGTTWNQLVPRDTTVADLGYHYDPLDYFITQYSVSGAPNVLNNGVSVGMYGSSGFFMQGGGGINVNGQPAQMSHIAWYPSVQEEPILLNNVSTAGSAVFSIGSVANSPKIIGLQFVEMAMQGQVQPFFDIGAAYYFPIASLRDCQLREVGLSVGNYYPGANSPGSSITLINNLLERSSANFFNGYALYYYGQNQYFVFQNPLSLTLYNNLFWQSGLGLTYAAAQQQYAMQWTIKDNLFDGASVSFSGDGSYSSYISKSNNGNNNTAMPSQLTDPATDVNLTALNYAPGPLGDRYIGSSSPTLIDAGSRTAAAAGLSSETILPSQMPDFCTVDVGFHYEAIWDNGSLPGNPNLVVSTNITPLEMAQLLVGPGVTVQNASYTAALEARGIFANGTICNFPISSGIILSSGSIANAIGPNNLSDATTDFSPDPGDPDLDNLTDHGPTTDAAVLQFDLISTSSFTLTFNYIFGSEEYPEFIGNFNDPMAIFVSPNATYSIADDIAMVPGTRLPVSVNTINGGCVEDFYGNPESPTNPQFYVDNHDPGYPRYSAQSPYAASAPVYNLQYDGFTTPLTAQINIAANVTYHVKIAIADYHDHIYDSAVFLQPWSTCQ